MAGFRNDYLGRQRLCLKCGTIWRMGKAGYAVLLATAGTLVVGGIIGFYLSFKPVEADIWSIVWLLLWMVFLWPVLYKTVWRIRVKF